MLLWSLYPLPTGKWLWIHYRELANDPLPWKGMLIATSAIQLYPSSTGMILPWHLPSLILLFSISDWQQRCRLDAGLHAEPDQHDPCGGASCTSSFLQQLCGADGSVLPCAGISDPACLASLPQAQVPAERDRLGRAMEGEGPQLLRARSPLKTRL